MEMTQHSLSWFEIPTVDFERARVFYGAIFDFDMPVIEMGTSLMGFFLHDRENGVGGAIIRADGHVPSVEGTVVYLSGGADLSVVLNRVEPAGGKIELGKTEIAPGMGFFAIFHDTEGNRVGLHSMG